MLSRVSNIETFRRWKNDESASIEDLVDRLVAFEPNEKMLAGTAFHKALELAKPGDYDTLYANGYTFHLPDGELALPDIRELRAFGNYGPLRVGGQVDALHGKTVTDHKTTERFDPESYLEGYQWRFYLDLFGADVFVWNVFEINKEAPPPGGQIDPMVYRVAEPHTLQQHRYPGMHDDCMRLALEFYEVTKDWLPDAILEAA